MTDDSARITTVGVITADRPAKLGRLLASLVDQLDAYGHRLRVVVVDGSRTVASRHATRSVATATAASSGHHIDYAGPAEARRFLRSLGPIAQPVAPPGTIGANRNLLLLLSAGERLLSFDDDVVCDTWTRPGDDRDLAVVGHNQDVFRTEFFSSRRAALAAVRFGRTDLVAAHGTLLDRPLRALLDESAESIDLDGICRHMAVGLAEGDPLVVRTTFAAMAGDAATYCPYRLLFSSGSLRAALWARPAAFRIAMRSREAVRIASSRIVMHDSGCMAACMGVANRELVPPFMPEGRNEDGVFGAMLAACDRSALFGHVPIGVVHDSHRPSHKSRASIRSATESRVSELLMALIPGLLPRDEARPVERRMRRLGQAFGRIGQLRRPDLVDLVRHVTSDLRAREWRLAEHSLADPACPAPWHAAARRYRRAYDASRRRRSFFLPIEFHGRGSIDDGYRALGRYFRTFGRLVEHWPVIWEAARQMNGERPRSQGLAARDAES